MIQLQGRHSDGLYSWNVLPFFFSPECGRYLSQGHANLNARKGKTRSLELAFGPMTGLRFGNPCCTLWGFMHLLDLEDQIGNGVEAFQGL